MRTKRITDLPRDIQEKYVRAVYGEWKIEPPTKPDWYWVYSAGSIEVVYYNEYKEVIVINREYAYEASDFKYWLGPIPQPEPPKD